MQAPTEVSITLAKDRCAVRKATKGVERPKKVLLRRQTSDTFYLLS